MSRENQSAASELAVELRALRAAVALLTEEVGKLRSELQGARGPAHIEEPPPIPARPRFDAPPEEPKGEPKKAARYHIPEGTKRRECKGCGRPIYFVPTPTGATMPCNPDGTSHMDTCPDRSLFRKG